MPWQEQTHRQIDNTVCFFHIYLLQVRQLHFFSQPFLHPNISHPKLFFLHFVLRNISLFQFWKTKCVKSHFPSISPVESAITASPPPAAWTLGDAACDVCARVWKGVCINLLSFLILQSYQEKWQAQMSRRNNYRSVIKCVCVFVCALVGWVVGQRGRMAVGPFAACWWELLLFSSSPLSHCLSPSAHWHTHTHGDPRTPVIRQLSVTQILT